MNRFLVFMKKNYKILLLIVAVSAGLWGFKSFQKEDPYKDKLLTELLTFVLEKAHYQPAKIDDAFSKQVYKKYMDNLDPSRRYFLQADVDEFKKYELAIDDMINERDLSFFELTYNRLMLRMKEAQDVYKQVLEEPIDFNIDEQVSTDFEKMAYASNVSELKERWRKQLKLSILSSVYDAEKLEKDSKEKDPKYTVKTFAELEKTSREKSLKSLNEYFEFVMDLERKDWFAMYLNAMVETFDPHSSYMSPDDKEKYDASISGSIEGIGARLQKKNDYTEISELIPGGPAWKSKEVEQGDLIMKVGQGKEDAIDIVGMRLDDVVKKIKGKKGTEVRLTVKKLDGTIKVISLIRDTVEFEESYAKSTIIEKDGKKFGFIYLPKFYINFENKDARDAFKDVAKEIENLKSQNVDGIAMDLRDNGGGSLQTVVDMVGLFIEEGPIVQVKSSNKRKEVLSDRDKKVQWDGPLVVMVNTFSASASEIFAAAIQDYNRGVIIGSKHTFGKGTVQNMIDLNGFLRNSQYGDLGALKATIQKFYRINGGSTQIEGVRSDIVVPDRYTYIDTGERDMDNALTWDKIDPASYKVLKNNFKDAIERSKKRVAANKQFKLIDENAKWIFERKDKNVYDLQMAKFKLVEKNVEEQIKKYKEISKYDNHLNFVTLPSEKALFAKDTTLVERVDAWHKQLKSDVYVEEAIQVLQDISPKKRLVKQ